MYPVSSVIQQLLIDLGSGSHPEDPDNEEWPIFTVHTPDSPDNCITVYDTQGILEGRFMVNGAVQEQFGFMLRVRANSSLVGNEKLLAIITQLDQEVYRQSVIILDEVGTNGQTYVVHSADRRGSVNHLGKDPSDKNRYAFTVNYTVTFD